MSTIIITARYTGGPIWEPDADSGKYSAVLVVEDKAQVAKLAAAVKEAIKTKFGDKPPAGLQNFAIRVGDDEGFASFGHNFINAKAAGKKFVGKFIRRNGSLEVVTRESGTIYSGCYVHAKVSVYAYPGDKARNIKPGVTVGLEALLFARDGERLGRIDNPEADFAGFNSEAAADDFGF